MLAGHMHDELRQGSDVAVRCCSVHRSVEACEHTLGIVAMIVQIVVYFLVRIPMPRVSERIEAGEIAAGIWLGVASLVAGILNAASMTV